MTQAYEILAASRNSTEGMKSAEDVAVSIDQDWGNEATIYSFEDGSVLVASGPQLNAYTGRIYSQYKVEADMVGRLGSASELEAVQASIKSINAHGLNEIHAFLAANHKRGGDHFTPSMLRAWASEAEFQLGEGNPPTIELKSYDSIHGYAQEFTVSDVGIDSVFVDAE